MKLVGRIKDGVLPANGAGVEKMVNLNLPFLFRICSYLAKRAWLLFILRLEELSLELDLLLKSSSSFFILTVASFGVSVNRCWLVSLTAVFSYSFSRIFCISGD